MYVGALLQHSARQLKILPLPSLPACSGFPDSSVDKESACNAGDLSSIPWSGRSAGEGRSYPLQYSWTSPVAQLVKNPPAMRETWVQSLDWEDPLVKRKATHSSVLAWRIPGSGEPGGLVATHHQHHRNNNRRVVADSSSEL